MKRKYAFLCNNRYHLMIAHSIASQLEGCRDLFVFSISPEVAKDPYLNFPGWDLKLCWHLEPGNMDLLKMAGSCIQEKLAKISEKNYDVVYYFVDKAIQNQLFLKVQKDSRKVLIEEGVGMYVSSRTPWLERLKISIVSLYKTGYMLKLCGGEQGANNYHEDLIVRYPKLVPIEKRKHCSVHGYDFPFTSDSFINHPYFIDLSGKKGGVLFIGSGPELVSKQWVSDAVEFDAFCGIFNKCKEYDLPVWVKPHPREPIEKYGRFGSHVSIVDSDAPLELIAHCLEPVVVMTVMSTALMNISPSVPRFYLYKIVGVSDYPNIKALSVVLAEDGDYTIPADMCEFYDQLREVICHDNKMELIEDLETRRTVNSVVVELLVNVENG